MQTISSGQTHNLPLIILISCVATIGGFLFGYDSGVINGTVDGLQTAFNSDSIGTGFNVSSMLLGCAVGAFLAGRLADKYGRRSVLMAAALFFIVSAWGSGIATTSMQFVIYRIIGGLAVGAASVMTPAYISEITPAKIRGRLSSIQQVAIITGLFAAFTSNYLLAKFAGASTSELWWGYDAWRWMFWAELFPACLFFVALIFIPESPRYLIASRKESNLAKAKFILNRLFGSTEKLEEIKHSLAEDHRPRFSDLLENGLPRKIVYVGIGLAVFQQLVGINVVFYYGAVLWQSVGFSEADALFINVISGAISIAGCFIALALIDHVGRKPLLWIGSAGMALTLTILTFCFAAADVDGIKGPVGVTALIAANSYLLFFNISWGPVMWVMLGEMFPNQIRGSGLAVAGLAQWLANFSITMTFPILLTTIGLANAYGIYAFFSFVSILFVLRYVDETRNKELEQM